MPRPKLLAKLRTQFGKEASKKLRQKGQAPAICYGPKTDPVPLTIDPKELMKTIQMGENVLIDLMIQDGKKAAQKVVVVRDLQIDPIKDQCIHADLFEVVMDEEISVEVPIVLVGKPEGVKMGGVLEQITREITMECLPGDIPQNIEVDVRHLEIGDTIHIGDIQLEKGKALVDPTTTLATVVPPTVEKVVVEEEVEEEIAEVEEAEEGAEEVEGEPEGNK
ncbi:MAG: 50S ribosomal protein L25 [Syntrophobacterales bacterium]|nr:MAG: 50S ribosomal protein L25 [Syntrophobacterales bacterium]